MNAHTFVVAVTDDALPTLALFVTIRKVVTGTDNVLPTQLMDYSRVHTCFHEYEHHHCQYDDTLPTHN